MIESNLSEAHCATLACIIALKSFARGEQMEREGLGAYTVDNPVIQTLVSARYLTVNRAGSITPDKDKIRTELKKYPHPTQYKLLGLNSYNYFKRQGE